jgi:hypothetical protein
MCMYACMCLASAAEMQRGGMERISSGHAHVAQGVANRARVSRSPFLLYVVVVVFV